MSARSCDPIESLDHQFRRRAEGEVPDQTARVRLPRKHLRTQ